jgi:hypothetical protein
MLFAEECKLWKEKRIYQWLLLEDYQNTIGI